MMQMKCWNYSKAEWSGWGLLALRVIVGLVFVIHGIQKFNGLEGTTKFFAGLGIPMASVMAVVVAAVETLGGIALITGAMTCVGSALLGIVMLTALFSVHFSKGFGQGGVEYPLVLIGALIAIFTGGPGALALGGHCCKKDSCGDCKTDCKDGTCEPKPQQ